MTIDKINWYGWSNSESGYGIVNLEYSTAIQRQGVEVYYGWERKEDLPQDAFNKLTEEQQKMLSKPFKKQRLGIIKTIPDMFYKNTSEFRIGYTMVENTKIGNKWVNSCNNMDAILVPSQFLVDVFKDCGVTKKVIAVKQGIDSRKFPYIVRRRKSKFIFGTVGYQDDRKNWEDLVRAFASEFEQHEPVELWIKNANPYWNPIFRDSRIKVINKMYSFEQIKNLYNIFDCFVFPSRAEGSGLPPREAMATGLPVIVTNWSGLTEIANESISYPINPISIDHVDVRGEEQPGFQATLDIQELMYQMRYVYENWTEALNKGKKASEFIHKEYNWDACAVDLINKVEAI